MEKILYKIVKVFLSFIHIINFITLIKFIRLHIVYWPELHNLMHEEITFIICSIFFIIIHYIVIKHPPTQATGKSKSSK